MLACFKKWLARHTQTAPPLCCFSLNEPSGLDSGASLSLATLAATQGRCSLIIIVAGKHGRISKAQQNTR